MRICWTLGVRQAHIEQCLVREGHWTTKQIVLLQMWELDQVRIKIGRWQVSTDPCWRWLCLCNGHSWWEDLWDGRPWVQGAPKTIFSHFSVSSPTFNVRSPISPPRHIFAQLVLFFGRIKNKNPFCAFEGIEYHRATWVHTFDNSHWTLYTQTGHREHGQ